MCYTPHGKDMIIFAILFHHPWCLIKQLFLCLIEEKVVLRLDRWYFDLPELPPPCIFPKKQTKQMSTAEYTEHIQGHWRNQPAPCYRSALNSAFYCFYAAHRYLLRGGGQDYTRRTRSSVAGAAVKGWLAWDPLHRSSGILCCIKLSCLLEAKYNSIVPTLAQSDEAGWGEEKTTAAAQQEGHWEHKGTRSSSIRVGWRERNNVCVERKRYWERKEKAEVASFSYNKATQGCEPLCCSLQAS